MTRIAAATLGLLLATGLQPAAAQDIEGLYRPAGSGWSCDPGLLGTDGGALGIVDGRIHGVENTCEVISLIPRDGWLAVKAQCAGEGERYLDKFRLRPVPGGLEFDRNGARYRWERCGAPVPVAPAPRNGDWVTGFGQGWEEVTTSDDAGNAIRLSCNRGAGPGKPVGYVWVTLSGSPAPAGPIAFDVDGRRTEYVADASGAVTIGDCPSCRAGYARLWESIAAGRLLTVIPARGAPVAFSLAGSRQALGQEPCGR